jgi:hypothetical protein
VVIIALRNYKKMKKTISIKKPLTKKSVEYDGTHRLVNKKTGKLASSSDWLIDLAASAVSLGDSQGLAALLPQEKARKLMNLNVIKPFNRHKKRLPVQGFEASNRELRDLANRALPYFAAFYTVMVIPGKASEKVNRKGFRAWLIAALSDPENSLNKDLSKHKEVSALAQLKRSDDWWQDRLNSESKSRKHR